MPKAVALLAFVFFIFSYGQEVKFAPLPKENAETLEKEYKPFLSWLSKQTGDKYTLVISSDYKDLISKIENGEIDLAYLGPLPYALIRQHTDSIKPIVKFLDKQGNSSYTCSIIASSKSNVKTIKELDSKKLSLTQKYSTCGYYSAKIAFDEHNLKLDKFSFDGNHANVALNVILGESLGGALQTSYFEKYSHLGLKKIYESRPYPGFMLAANKNKLDSKRIAKIKSSLIALSPLTRKSDIQETKKWADSIRYGAVDANENEYSGIVNEFEKMEILR